MRINRQALILACEHAMKAQRAQWVQQQHRRQEVYAQKLQAWRDAHAAEWAAAGTKIRRVLREGGAVTLDLLPQRYHHQLSLFQANDPTGDEFTPDTELAALVTVLHTVTDDVVTMSALERLGINRTTIRAAVQHLSAATVEGAS